MIECKHANVEMVNPHEILRKYRCLDCNGLMMCACEYEFGSKFLPHQLNFIVDPQTQDRLPVDLGAVPNICNTCRGLPETAYPRHAHHGATSKVRRYYWREIFKDTRQRYAKWCETNGVDYTKPGHHNTPEYQLIEKEVVEFWTNQHKNNLKHVYNDPPPFSVIEECEVEVINFDGQYVKNAGKDKPLLYLDGRYGPEELVAHIYREQGWNVEFMESIPFQALFGVLAWLWVQDGIRDPKVRIVGFGGRDGYGADKRGVIWTHLPSDFGTQHHFQRREQDFIDHLHLMGNDKANLLWTFDYWTEPSRPLRQYLWAYKEDDLRRARKIVEILSLETVKNIVTYLAESYWDRYLGWPDLFLWKDDQYMFIEVKGSKDKLSEDQQNWVRENHSRLKLPFKLAKIHKASTVEL